MALGLQTVAATAAVAPVGQGFTVTPSDLAFILKQIKIAEHHAATLTPANPCGTLVGSGPDQIPDALTSYGLRTVDGSCNNLIPGREKFGAADQPFPRFTNPVFKAAEDHTSWLRPARPDVLCAEEWIGVRLAAARDQQPDRRPDVDQPGRRAAAAFPVRTQGNPGSSLAPRTRIPGARRPFGVPAGCVPSHKTLFIPNVTTDVGLSPPYNSLFTFFGQFFDHGVDQTVKSGGTVFVPLHGDDPLIAGPDHIFGNADDLTPNLRFMVLTRAQNQPGPDGILGDNPATTPVDESADDIQNANNTGLALGRPEPDLHLALLAPGVPARVREQRRRQAGLDRQAARRAGRRPDLPRFPGRRTGMATWASLKAQAATMLGLRLVDTDVTNIPMIATDPYGKFLPGPARGLPQYVTATGLVEGAASPTPRRAWARFPCRPTCCTSTPRS